MRVRMEIKLMFFDPVPTLRGEEAALGTPRNAPSTPSSSSFLFLRSTIFETPFPDNPRLRGLGR